MSAYLTLGHNNNTTPISGWFAFIGTFADDYPLALLPELYYELECADLGKGDLDNLYIKDYTNLDNFYLNEPDD